MKSKEIIETAKNLQYLESFGGSLKREFAKKEKDRTAMIQIDGYILRIKNNVRLSNILDITEQELVDQLKNKRQSIKELTK